MSKSPIPLPEQAWLQMSPREREVFGKNLRSRRRASRTPHYGLAAFLLTKLFL